MQEMSKALRDYMESLPPEKEGRPDAEVEFRKAAGAWAVFCLRTFTGELLRRGLGVSAAITDFLAELEGKAPPA